MKAEIIPHVDTAYMDELWLDRHERLKLLPAEEFRRVPHDHLRAWCARRAIYCVPTAELVAWLRLVIGPRTALEVAAGNNDLGYLLGVTTTDSYLQQRPEIQFALAMGMGSRGTSPRYNVKRYDALAAVRRFRPQVVVAAWLTRKFIRGVDREGAAQANIYGAEEERLIAEVETYIHVGNSDVHGEKTALKLPHRAYKFPWLVSRAANQENNCVYVWGLKINDEETG